MSSSFNPDRMDRRVTLEELQTKRDSFGQAIQQYVSLGDVWCEVTPLGGTERRGGGPYDRFPEATHKFLIRWRPGITVRHRVVHEGASYGITAILEVGRREGLELLAAASAAEAPRD